MRNALDPDGVGTGSDFSVGRSRPNDLHAAPEGDMVADLCGLGLGVGVIPRRR